MITTLDTQKRLTELGFDPGPLDGVTGRRTIAAIKAFQVTKKLVADGIVGPQTSAVLFPALPHYETEALSPPWIDNIKPYIGLQEVRDNKKLEAYLDSDGSTVGDPSKIPWCGDLVQTALALTLPDEPLPSNPYWALNWASWGRAIPKGMFPYGALGTKSRNGGGHVFFIIGHDDTYVHALGGNQSNSICVIKIRKDILNGLRWPVTYPLPTASMPETTITATINATEV